ncbi:MAG: YhbY family RNA-binding protein [Candidatus Bathyarchaeia archaeon]
MKRSAAKKESGHIEATVRIGKRGITEAQVKEISKQLDAKRKVKVKVLRSALMESSIEEIAQKVSSETGSKIIQVIGHTFTLYKPKKRKVKIVK